MGAVDWLQLMPLPLTVRLPVIEPDLMQCTVSIALMFGPQASGAELMMYWLTSDTRAR
jgi:hypothetical protein